MSAGGGLVLSESHAILIGNTIISNTADHDGGGLILFGTDATLTNKVIADNQTSTMGIGLSIEAFSLSLLHNTIARNSGNDGSGIWISDSTIALTNNIIADHAVCI